MPKSGCVLSPIWLLLLGARLLRLLLSRPGLLLSKPAAAGMAYDGPAKGE
jgi:hypothetical protein